MFHAREEHEVMERFNATSRILLLDDMLPHKGRPSCSPAAAGARTPALDDSYDGPADAEDRAGRDRARRVLCVFEAVFVTGHDREDPGAAEASLLRQALTRSKRDEMKKQEPLRCSGSCLYCLIGVRQRLFHIGAAVIPPTAGNGPRGAKKESVSPSAARTPSGRTTRRGGASGASAARSTTAVAFRSRMTRLTRAVWVPPPR